MKKILLKTIMYLAFVISLGCCLLLVINFYKAIGEQSKFEKLQQFQNISSLSSGTHNETATATDNKSQESSLSFVSQYENIFKQNTDMIAWIEIKNTSLSYPVMQSQENPNYYLKRNFDGEYSEYGVPYLSENCDILLSDNLIIYGHNMENGKMFGLLEDYKEKEFWEQHQTITLNTKSDKRTYKIFCVSLVTAFAPEVDPFPYYNFTNANNFEEYNDYIKSAKKYSIYDTESLPEKKAQLITLSTCEYSQKNGRLIVVAYFDEAVN